MDGHVFSGQPTFFLFQLIILAHFCVCCRRCRAELFFFKNTYVIICAGLLLCDSQNDKIMCNCPNQ